MRWSGWVAQHLRRIVHWCFDPGVRRVRRAHHRTRIGAHGAPYCPMDKPGLRSFGADRGPARIAQPIHPAEKGLDRGGDDVAVDADAVLFSTTACRGQFDEGAGLRVARVFAGMHRTLFVTAHLHVDARALQGMHGGVDRAVAFAGQQVRDAIDFNGKPDALCLAVFEQMVFDGK
jgi:hypothetical protein